MNVKDFRELNVYKTALASAMKVFLLSRKWPQEETGSLTSRIRNSTRSVAARIAEAWKRRRYPSFFASKLSEADAEAGETLVWLDFALRCGYLQKSECSILMQTYDRICDHLVTMTRHADRWCEG